MHTAVRTYTRHFDVINDVFCCCLKPGNLTNLKVVTRKVMGRFTYLLSLHCSLIVKNTGHLAFASHYSRVCSDQRLFAGSSRDLMSCYKWTKDATVLGTKLNSWDVCTYQCSNLVLIRTKCP